VISKAALPWQTPFFQARCTTVHNPCSFSFFSPVCSLHLLICTCLMPQLFTHCLPTIICVIMLMSCVYTCVFFLWVSNSLVNRITFKDKLDIHIEMLFSFIDSYHFNHIFHLRGVVCCTDENCTVVTFYLMKQLLCGIARIQSYYFWPRCWNQTLQVHTTFSNEFLDSVH